MGKLDFMTPGLSLAAAPSSMRLAEKLGLGVSNSALECYSGGCTSSMATVFHVNYGAAGRAVWTGVAGKDREAWGGRRYGHGKGKGRSVVECVGVSGSGSGAGERREQQQQQSGVVKFFNVEDPRGAGVSLKKGAFDVNTAWELLRQDVLYLDWKARRDVLAIVNAHDKVVEVLNPLVRDVKSVESLRSELAGLQEELSKAHAQVHLSEARVEHTLRKLGEMESLVNDKLLQNINPKRGKTVPKAASTMEPVVMGEAEADISVRSRGSTSRGKPLDVSGPMGPYPAQLKNHWYPAAFSADIDDKTMVPFDSFEEAWVIFRGKDGRPGCVRDSCAHRACPLSLGKVEDGRIQCPYHGWEYNTSGKCEKMPSTRLVNAELDSLPCIEQDGMVWIWPGNETPSTNLPCLNPPSHYTIHAQITMELPVEHGLLVENLLDLAHAPFTHTTTFAKGWEVPSFVKFRTPIAALSGTWDPYPIAMEFKPPCMVLSTIGLEKPGKLNGTDVDACPTHLHQLHVCMPSSKGKTRLLYRMALDFAPYLKHVPFIKYLWQHLANKVLGEDLRLVEGQQDRMERGANVWNLPVAYDKLGVRYRRWRVDLESGDEKTPFMSD